MFTTNLLDLSPQELDELRILIKVYATTEVIGEHFLFNHAHQVVTDGAGVQFFEWHRRYLRGMDDFLRSRLNYPDSTPDTSQTEVQPRLNRTLRSSTTASRVLKPELAEASRPRERPPIGPSRLPFWQPWDPIPQEFLSPRDRTLSGAPTMVHQPHGITRGYFGWWLAPHVKDWENADRMGLVLSWGPHFHVHAMAGGTMKDLHRAPEAAIFWPWHAFLDNIYSEYLASGGSKGVFDYTGKYPPWAPQPPPTWWGQPVTVPTIDGRVRVPFCMGSTLSGATQTLRRVGLTVGNTECFETDIHLVCIQWPMPGKSVDEGTPVHLSSACFPH